MEAYYIHLANPDSRVDSFKDASEILLTQTSSKAFLCLVGSLFHAFGQTISQIPKWTVNFALFNLVKEKITRTWKVHIGSAFWFCLEAYCFPFEACFMPLVNPGSRIECKFCALLSIEEENYKIMKKFIWGSNAFWSCLEAYYIHQT